MLRRASRPPLEELSPGAMIARLRWERAKLAVLDPHSPAAERVRRDEHRLAELLHAQLGVDTIVACDLEWFVAPRRASTRLASTRRPSTRRPSTLHAVAAS